MFPPSLNFHGCKNCTSLVFIQHLKFAYPPVAFLRVGKMRFNKEIVVANSKAEVHLDFRTESVPLKGYSLPAGGSAYSHLDVIKGCGPKWLKNLRF